MAKQRLSELTLEERRKLLLAPISKELAEQCRQADREAHWLFLANLRELKQSERDGNEKKWGSSRAMGWNPIA